LAKAYFYFSSLRKQHHQQQQPMFFQVGNLVRNKKYEKKKEIQTLHGYAVVFDFFPLRPLFSPAS